MAAQPFRTDPSATGAFQALSDALPDLGNDICSGEPLRAVVIGGGTGAPMSIRTLLSLGVETSCVVAMADDGGSTGILREEADVTPPGDVRKCIVAFAKDPRDPLVRAMKYRFLVARDHALGNLLLAALEDACGSFPDAVAICERLVDAQGHVYPSTLDPVTLYARTRDGRYLDGQAVSSHSHTALDRVELHSTSAMIRPYAPALKAIRDADLIVLGPGSLFTSIIPNLLVPGIVDAIRDSRGRVLFVCSLADVQGETWGLTAYEHFCALSDHGMEGLVDYMLVHAEGPVRAESPNDDVFANAVGWERSSDGVELLGESCSPSALNDRTRHVAVSHHDIQAIQAEGPVVIVRDLADADNPTWHSPFALRLAFQDVIRMVRSRKR